MELALQRHPADLDEVFPQHAVADPAALQLGGRPAGAVAVVGIGFRPAGRFRIQPVEHRQVDMVAKGLHDLPFVGDADVARRVAQPLHERPDERVLVADSHDQQAHLKAPVAEVGVAQDLVAAEAVDAFDGFADDRRPQVAHVHRLGHIGSAVVDHDPARLGDLAAPVRGSGGNLARPVGQGPGADAQIDEAEPCDLHRLQQG